MSAPAFPKGTIIHVTAFYDNTKANKNNPDPNQWVGYGDRTVDEMAHAWMNVFYLSDAEYQDWIAGAAASQECRCGQTTQNTAVSPDVVIDRGAGCIPRTRSFGRSDISADDPTSHGESLPMDRMIVAAPVRRCCLSLGSAVLSAQVQLPSSPPKQFGAQRSHRPSKAGSTIPTARTTFLIGYYSRNTEGGDRHPDRPEQPFRPGPSRPWASRRTS